MKSSPTTRTDGLAGFTLVEVLASLLVMAIIIPVALEGMSIVSRAANLGEHKVAAMRVAERVIDEQLSVVEQGQPIPTSGSGTETDGNESYPWTMQTAPWPQDAMTEMTVRVTFTLQGHSYEMSLCTLFDPNANIPGVPGAAQPVSGQANPS
jgi:prepilin-type N-terminal cleavage/methylation domain-containing protein